MPGERAREISITDGWRRCYLKAFKLLRQYFRVPVVMEPRCHERSQIVAEPRVGGLPSIHLISGGVITDGE
jgi:hypothetical protein